MNSLHEWLYNEGLEGYKAMYDWCEEQTIIVWR